MGLYARKRHKTENRKRRKREKKLRKKKIAQQHQ